MRYGAQTLRVDAELDLVPRHPNDSLEAFELVRGHRDDLREWLTWIDGTYGADDVRRYARFAETQFEQQTAFDYLLRWQGAAAGGMGLHNLDWGSRTAHIGYWLAPPFRGRGMITRSCGALTTHAFANLNMHRLEIRCVVENASSRAVAERLGYRHEATLREAYLLHGRFRDLALYAMTAGEWK